MPYSARNIKIASNNAGLTHYGGISFFCDSLRVLQQSVMLVEESRKPHAETEYQRSSSFVPQTLWLSGQRQMSRLMQGFVKLIQRVSLSDLHRIPCSRGFETASVVASK